MTLSQLLMPDAEEDQAWTLAAGATQTSLTSEPSISISFAPYALPMVSFRPGHRIYPWISLFRVTTAPVTIFDPFRMLVASGAISSRFLTMTLNRRVPKHEVRARTLRAFYDIRSELERDRAAEAARLAEYDSPYP